MRALEQSLSDQLSSAVEAEGLELVAAEVAGEGRRTTLRLVIDGPDGVTLDQCASVSRQASALLDVEDPIRHAYVLEVTSPGLDRKLYDRPDYQRFAGRRVKVRMAPSYREHRVVTGELMGVHGDHVLLRPDDEQTVELPLADVFEARLEVDWTSIMNEGKRRR